ncbi:MAG: FAD-binding and (Fe-S)-binding domain-containing protein, partial [Actinomycetota bacterium]
MTSAAVTEQPDAGYDPRALARRLDRDLRGSADDSTGARALYATDASNYRVVPDVVVVPADPGDVVTAVMLAAEAGAPIVVRGAGTSMAGNAIGGVVIDVSRHVDRILDLDPESMTAVVEPGVVLTSLTARAARHGLTVGPDPSSASRATLGGMIANNACGAHSVAWGTTADNVLGLDVLLADGTRLDVRPPGPGAPDVHRRMRELATRPGSEGDLHRRLQQLVADHSLLVERRFSGLRRRISGYAMDRLLPAGGYDVARFLCGTEGTLATTLRATVRLVRLPPAKVLLVLGFRDSMTAADCVPHVLPHGPLTMESINSLLVERLPDQVRDAARRAGLPAGKAWLLVEMGGECLDEAVRSARAVVADLDAAGVPASSSVVTDPGAQAVLWRCRRDGTGLATRRLDGGEAWAGWEDAAVPPERLGAYLRELDELMATHGLSGASYGHFGEGCMHMRIDFDLFTPQGVATFRTFVEEATDLVVRLGGSVSGEHGDGRARSEMLTRMYGADVMRLFSDVKALWDPRGVMNPGVISDPRPVDRDLRHLGRTAATGHPGPVTLLAYPEDGGSFAQAQRRCVGVGKCVQHSGGVMCPSYQVTREEKHSTRGRAHLLWEMLQGEVVTGGWRSPEVRDALDLCLSCKGCLSDCPVNVDMATYKSEFLHHHYAGRLRPRSHYSMGWLPVWARLAALAPGLVNRLTSSRLQRLLKVAGGVAPERQIPAFAAEPLTRWLRRRRRRDATSDAHTSTAHTPTAPRGRVVLFPDTFTTYLEPRVGRAAVRVLEAAGFEVVVPKGQVCCGLTWMSTGQLSVARRVLRRSLRAIEAELRDGVPV